jgi:hypothetical protein
MGTPITVPVSLVLNVDLETGRSLPQFNRTSAEGRQAFASIQQNADRSILTALVARRMRLLVANFFPHEINPRNLSH